MNIRNEANQQVYDKWVYVPDACNHSSCSHTISLPQAGAYTWWGRGWGPAGMGDWSQSSFTLVIES